MKAKMKTEDLAYIKMGRAITRRQRKKWNANKYEMMLLAETLRDQARHHGKWYADKGERLLNLVCQLPMFDLDGEGIARSGNAVEDF